MLSRLSRTSLQHIPRTNTGIQRITERGQEIAPEWIRTTDLPLRRRLLYPAELRALVRKTRGFCAFGQRFRLRRHPRLHQKDRNTWPQRPTPKRRNRTLIFLCLLILSANGRRKSKERCETSGPRPIQSQHCQSISTGSMRFKRAEIPGKRVSNTCLWTN